MRRVIGFCFWTISIIQIFLKMFLMQVGSINNLEYATLLFFTNKKKLNKEILNLEPHYWIGVAKYFSLHPISSEDNSWGLQQLMPNPLPFAKEVSFPERLDGWLLFISHMKEVTPNSTSMNSRMDTKLIFYLFCFHQRKKMLA